MLATLHGDRTWAIRTVGGLQGAAVRAEDADAAVGAFVVDNAGQAPAEEERLAEFVRGRGGVGSYLKNAKFHGDRARAAAARLAAPRTDPGSSPGSVPPEAAKVLEVFAVAWEAKYRREFLRTPDAVRLAAGLLALARSDARAFGGTGGEAIRRRADAYLADGDTYLVERSHPFTIFVKRINQYEPKAAKKPAAPRAPEPPPPSAEENAALAAAARASLGLVGKGPSEPIARPS